jgi:hypothetical protein
MYVMRLKSIDSIFSCGSFTSRLLASSSFESDQNQVIGDVNGAAIFDIASASDPRIATQLARDGRVAVSQIYPRPMTQAQAAACQQMPNFVRVSNPTNPPVPCAAGPAGLSFLHRARYRDGVGRPGNS